MEERVGSGILGAAARGEDADDLAVQQKLDIAAKLKSTGQARDDDEARELAELAYNQIWGNTWRKIRERVNAGAGSARQAASEIAREAAEKDPVRIATREALERDRERQVGREGAQQGRMADAALGPAGAEPIARMMIQARQARLWQAHGSSPARRRQWARMDFAEREAAVGRVNDGVDAQATAYAKRYLLRSGFTRDPDQADATARRITGAAAAWLTARPATPPPSRRPRRTPPPSRS